MVDDAERTPDLAASFPREAVRSGLHCADWREAVRAAGSLLVATGAATEDYVDAIVRAVEELGPYIVLAPGIALAHARPEDGGTAVGFSLVKLAEPVEFGSEHNDPVDLVFAFASPDSEQHITALAALADFIESGDNLARIRAASNDEELYRVIQEAN
ncbi:MAG TPA: PTS sugar transporter subunit IIA [Acidimicrobiia bacterium]|nr:PTS sugar transporter subunit IIA [Acidimicrobiia bacterium]